ncbi:MULTISPECIES: family 43 glycosylhydrolase [Sphingobacterium]|uniref:family 43 glycosylhydrolase n=1 Tax=Sphingobacterium TaxID=28453 RepID=UPI00257A76AB|nr:MULTISPECIES: family 43 glycosylhydrolase [Sphingobacterium]
MKHHFSFAILAAMVMSLTGLVAQPLKPYQQPNVLNPLLPGYFADPSIKKIADTYYIYATTDGNGWGAGPSQVWSSRDLKNWTIQPMNWPNTHWYWAPDMTQGYDGRYYLYYSQPVEIFGAVADSPTGPWEPLVAEGKSMIPNYMIPGVITLDGQTFRDDDGRIYLFWGTWGIYPDHGCGVGILNRDMKTFDKTALIPNTVAKDFFEAPYMFKRKGIYYLMYSSGHCEDGTYRVQYVKSKTGPMGPFEYPSTNPILITNEDGSIHGPGHHSILEQDNRYFIVYHRHNNPHAGGGFHRQVAMDELFFRPDGDIEPVRPTHAGVPDLFPAVVEPVDLAFGKTVTASSWYNTDFRPSFLVDNNNGTLWRAKNNQGPAWVAIDLGKTMDIQTISIQFEYPTYAYRYRLETSMDGIVWENFVDRSDNDRWASPIVEHGKARTRYVRLNVLNSQLNGLPRGVWNMKVYAQKLPQQTLWSAAQKMPVQEVAVGNLIHIDAANYQEGQYVKSIQNKGLLGGMFSTEQALAVKNYQGKKAFFFDGGTALRSTFAVPQSLAANGSYSIGLWVNNPDIARFEQLVAWSSGQQDLSKAIFGYGTDAGRGAITHGSWPDLGYASVPDSNVWHHIVFSFDGYQESVYVDGKLQRRENRMLFVKPGDVFVLGASDILDQHFSGYVSSLQVYNTSLDEEEVVRLANEVPKSNFFALQTDDLNLGKLSTLRNQGTAKDTLVTVDDAEVMIAGNRLALKGKAFESSALREILQLQRYTLYFDWYDDGSWQHAVLVNDKGKKSFYRNGKIEKRVFSDKLLRVSKNTLELAYPFHFFRAYAGTVTSDEVDAKFSQWKAGLAKGLDGYVPQVLSPPRLINADQVFAQVEKKPGMWYLFRSDGESSGWKQQSYHLFKSSGPGKSIEVLAKDAFGHVSKPVVEAISAQKPKLVQPAQDESYSAKDQEIPFWDGYHYSEKTDSTQTALSYLAGTWKIQSKNTKWGDADLLAPFVFKELEGDFTLEVKVSDVVGLGRKVRTSSEAGVMIQSMDRKDAYISNCILTGWNLGNLSRSIGPQIFQEENTGTGLNFSPYLQVQKVGSYFFLRCSIDGVDWKDLPGTPFLRPDLNGKRLRVGLYQIAGNNQLGYGEFERLCIWK